MLVESPQEMSTSSFTNLLSICTIDSRIFVDCDVTSSCNRVFGVIKSKFALNSLAVSLRKKSSLQ